MCSQACLHLLSADGQARAVGLLKSGNFEAINHVSIFTARNYFLNHVYSYFFGRWTSESSRKMESVWVKKLLHVLVLP